MEPEVLAALISTPIASWASYTAGRAQARGALQTMRLQAQRDACLNVMKAAHDLSQRVYPTLKEIIQSEGPAETPPDFLKAEQAAIRAAVDRLELEGPAQIVPLAHEIIQAAKDIDEDCMMQIPALEAIYEVAGDFTRRSRLFNLSKELTRTYDQDLLEEVRHTIIYEERTDEIRKGLQPLVDQGGISAFTANEIATCNWDHLVGVDGGIHQYLDDARDEFTKAAHAYLDGQQNPRRRWPLRRRRSQSSG